MSKSNQASQSTRKTTPKSAVVTAPLRRKKAVESDTFWSKVKSFFGLGPKKRRSASLTVNSDDVIRIYIIWAIMLLGFVALVAMAFYRQVIDAPRLKAAAEGRSVTTRTVTSPRGMIFDRNDTPLAANAPLLTVFFDAEAYAAEYYRLNKILQNVSSDTAKSNISKKLDALDLVKVAAATGYPLEKLQAAVQINDKLDYQADDIDAQIAAAMPKAAGRRRVVLLNRVSPEIAAPVLELKVGGSIGVDQLDQRYYLQAEPNAQIIGFLGRSQNDDSLIGRAGLEAQFNQYLTGKEGKIVLLRDRLNMPISEISVLKEQVKSQDLHLTIDSRLQYVLYKELEQVGRLQSARSSSGMVVDVQTGEVLAMSSWPSFNSNNLSDRDGANERNRPVMDVFEPGSVVKPFTVAAALESGKYSTTSIIDTNPGSLSVGGYTIRDGKNYGAITLAGLIQRSSNVASAKIALNLSNDAIVNMQKKFGLGQKTTLNFPSEASGTIRTPSAKETSRRATLSYGYGQEVTLAQLVQAYATLANNGVKQPLNLVKDIEKAKPERVISAAHAQEITKMMELVTASGGTGVQAAINGYRVAGKTGTSRRANPKGGYYTDQHRTIFAGFAPASSPRFVVAILVEDPREQFYAGQVSAPVFRNVMKEALRLYNVPFDKPLYAEVPAAPAPTKPKND